MGLQNDGVEAGGLNDVRDEPYFLTLLQQAIARLPDLYRAVYVLAEIEGLPHQEIATILGITVSTAKTRLHRARLLLPEALANYFKEKVP